MAEKVLVLADIENIDNDASTSQNNAEFSATEAKTAKAGVAKDFYLSGRTIFPTRLHHILSDETYASIISWLPNSKAWKLHDPERFETEIIPGHFKLTKLSSFTRQVNGWGFQRITQGKDKGGFYHEFFIRGQPERCTMMVRHKKKIKFHANQDGAHTHDGKQSNFGDPGNKMLPLQDRPAVLVAQSLNTGDSGYNVNPLLQTSGSTSGLNEIRNHMLTSRLIRNPQSLNTCDSDIHVILQNSGNGSGLYDLRNQMLTSRLMNTNRLVINSPTYHMNLNNANNLRINQSEVAMSQQARWMEAQRNSLILDQETAAFRNEFLGQRIQNGHLFYDASLVPNLASSSRFINYTELPSQRDMNVTYQQLQNPWRQNFSR